MILLATTAYAHPNALSHLHTTDPAATALVAFWLVLGAAFAVGARRVLTPAG